MLKAIKVNEEAHAIIKQFCKDNALKVGAFVEQLCLRHIEGEGYGVERTNSGNLHNQEQSK